MAENSKLIIASLKSGKEVKLSQRDFLVVQQYAEGKGIELEIVGKKGMQLTINCETIWTK